MMNFAPTCFMHLLSGTLLLYWIKHGDTREIVDFENLEKIITTRKNRRFQNLERNYNDDSSILEISKNYNNLEKSSILKSRKIITTT